MRLGVLGIQLDRSFSGFSRVTFYAAGLAGNGNGSETGDRTYLGAFSLFESAAVEGYEFVPVNPCRIVDTRTAPGSFGATISG